MARLPRPTPGLTHALYTLTAAICATALLAAAEPAPVASNGVHWQR